MTNTTNERVDAWYGKSMYGGWYYGTFDGKKNAHTELLRDLKRIAEENNVNLRIRMDNE